MQPSDLPALFTALRTSDHRFKGIRPKDATPAEAPAALIQPGYETPLALDYACAAARDYWPDTNAWELIGSDELLHLQDPTWPPTIRAMRQPLTLATFQA